MVANGGTALPMDGGHDTKVGISFGENNPNGKTGYLRLQYVPYTLDFGNHKLFDGSAPTFDANGLNVKKDTNNVSLGYTGSEGTEETNKTDLFNNKTELTQFNANAKGTNKHAWATVVDKQDSRTQAENDLDTTKQTDSAAGTWTLSVKSNGALTGQATGVVKGAKLVLGSTEVGNTANVQALTGEDQDANYTPTWADGDITPAATDVALDLDKATDSDYVEVATAAADKGAGADVFAWNHDNIKLTLPSNSAIFNDVYTTNLSWKLSTGLTNPVAP